MFESLRRIRRPAGSGRSLRRYRRCMVERLEERSLLSAAGLHAEVCRSTAIRLNSPAAASPSNPAGGYMPAQVRAAYGFDQVAFQSGSTAVAGNGSGQTIAIVDAYDDPNILKDANAFSAQFGLLKFNAKGGPTFTKMNQNGSTKKMPPRDILTGWSSEIALDVEWAHSIAPNANIILVEANSNYDSDLFTAVKTAASQRGVVAVSMSWGGNEDPAEEAAEDKMFAGFPNVTFCAASGDTGATAIYPSTLPCVLSVGGRLLGSMAPRPVSRAVTRPKGPGAGAAAARVPSRASPPGRMPSRTAVR